MNIIVINIVNCYFYFILIIARERVSFLGMTIAPLIT